MPAIIFEDAARRVYAPVGILRSEAFVVVSMTVDDQCCSRAIQIFPKRLHGRIVPNFTRAEKRLVKIGKRALCRMCLEVASQPCLLGKSRSASSGNFGAVGIQHDNVPETEFIAVVTFVIRSCAWSKVAEITRGVLRVIFVVANCRPGPGLEAAPCRTVATLEFPQACIRRCKVPIGEDRAGSIGKQFSRGAYSNKSAHEAWTSPAPTNI